MARLLHTELHFCELSTETGIKTRGKEIFGATTGSHKLINFSYLPLKMPPTQLDKDTDNFENEHSS